MLLLCCAVLCGVVWCGVMWYAVPCCAVLLLLLCSAGLLRAVVRPPPLPAGLPCGTSLFTDFSACNLPPVIFNSTNLPTIQACTPPSPPAAPSSPPPSPTNPTTSTLHVNVQAPATLRPRLCTFSIPSFNTFLDLFGRQHAAAACTVSGGFMTMLVDFYSQQDVDAMAALFLANINAYVIETQVGSGCGTSEVCGGRWNAGCVGVRCGSSGVCGGRWNAGCVGVRCGASGMCGGRWNARCVGVWCGASGVCGER